MNLVFSRNKYFSFGVIFVILFLLVISFIQFSSENVNRANETINANNNSVSFETELCQKNIPNLLGDISLGSKKNNQKIFFDDDCDEYCMSAGDWEDWEDWGSGSCEEANLCVPGRDDDGGKVGNCYCDEYCMTMRDCCSDFESFCLGEQYHTVCQNNLCVMVEGPGTNLCSSDNDCDCPDDEIMCGEACCAGTCYNDAICCPIDYSLCGNSCCPPELECADASSSTCCPEGYTSNGGACCAPGHMVCGDGCCPNHQTCSGTAVGGNTVCCSDGWHPCTSDTYWGPSPACCLDEDPDPDPSPPGNGNGNGGGTGPGDGGSNGVPPVDDPSPPGNGNGGDPGDGVPPVDDPSPPGNGNGNGDTPGPGPTPPDEINSIIDFESVYSPEDGLEVTLTCKFYVQGVLEIPIVDITRENIECGENGITTVFEDIHFAEKGIVELTFEIEEPCHTCRMSHFINIRDAFEGISINDNNFLSIVALIVIIMVIFKIEKRKI